MESNVTLSNTLLQQLLVAAGSQTVSSPSVLSVHNSRVPIEPVYSYRVKIISPSKKTDVVVRQLHRVTSKFHSVSALRTALSDEFESHVSNTSNFNVGYMEGNGKIWLVNTDDIKSMYQKYSKGGQITLWCDGKSDDNTSEPRSKRKCDNDDCRSIRRHEQEEVEEAYKTLKEKHSGQFDIPKLRLWSPMICSGLHEDYEKPPKIPAFSMQSPKKSNSSQKKASENSPAPSPECSISLSPSKTVDLRMKNLQQLRYL